ncbi:MAG: hypothetical protein ACTHOM_11855 [Allomuricauda sp.]|uniref:Uncharacterized protein n=1 Tax=Flagellimonas profundi TaxID=2915620 RepID=A0ABS3FJP1_9FLAO|nr:hypothetical protein [Allomuricauda profundi]MBO0342910.1 hypothetical protein [Allomuricauda profundi]
MNDSKSEISGFLKRINLIHKAILVSPIALGIVFYFMADNPYLFILNAWDTLLVIVISAIVLGIFLSDLLFKKKLSGIAAELSLSKKLERFQTALLLKMVFLEIPAIFSTAVFYLTQNLLYLIITIGMVLYMNVKAPKKERIIHALDLRGAEKDKMNQAH